MTGLRQAKNELFGIQILRALAALGVVTHHTLEQSNGADHKFSPDWLTTSGASGVDMFFVISGFIMLYVSFPTKRPPVSPLSFMLRRITRIYPLYWLCCAATILIFAAGFLKHDAMSSYDKLASLLLLPSHGMYLAVSWTLVYEIYFYAVFAVTLLFRSALFSAAATSIVITGFVLLGSAGAGGTFLANPIPLEFCMGLWLAWTFLSLEQKATRWPFHPIVALFGFGVLAVAPLWVHHATTGGLSGLPRVAAWGVPAALIVASLLNLAAPKGALPRFLLLLGDASYALYLTHQFVMDGYAALIKRTALRHFDQVLIVPLVVLTAVAIGIAAHLLVERPALRIVRHLTQSNTTAMVLSETP